MLCFKMVWFVRRISLGDQFMPRAQIQNDTASVTTVN